MLFRKAHNSLTLAKAADLSMKDAPTDRICVECQMCAEFSMKSFLLANKQQYRKHGHNLNSALKACIKIDSSFNQLKTVCDKLMNYKTVLEYELDEEAFPTVSDAKKCIRHAEEVYNFVEELLENMGFIEPKLPLK